jgi:ornithine carbamoyltransferase
MHTETPSLSLLTDYLRVSDLDEPQFARLLELAAIMKHAPESWWTHTLEGRTVAMFFEKPSTRTRVSFAVACHRLGVQPLLLRPDELQIGRGETIADTARTLASYCSAIVIRTFAQDLVEEVARFAAVPVINALTDAHHPCQALADMLTLKERFGDLEGLRLAYVGDSDNVARSLMEAGALAGVHVVVAAPEAYEPSAGVMRAVTEFAGHHHAHVSVVHDPREAVEGANAVYTDVWVSMGAEADADARMRELEPYRVTPELMALAAPDAIFMHCLPAHRGEEVAPEVIDGPASAVWQQAANRMPTEQALLYVLISGRWRS